MIIGRKDRLRVKELEKDLTWLLSEVAMTPIRFNEDLPGREEKRILVRKDTANLVNTYDSMVKRRYGYDPATGWPVEVLDGMKHQLLHGTPHRPC